MRNVLLCLWFCCNASRWNNCYRGYICYTVAFGLPYMHGGHRCVFQNYKNCCNSFFLWGIGLAMLAVPDWFILLFYVRVGAFWLDVVLLGFFVHVFGVCLAVSSILCGIAEIADLCSEVTALFWDIHFLCNIWSQNITIISVFIFC